LNKIYDHPFTKNEIFKMGVSIGADVPFLLQQKPAIATGIGDKLKAYNRLRPLKILLVCPTFVVSTAMVYKNLNLRLTKCAKKLKQFHSDRLDFDIKKHLCNDLEPITGGLYPDIFNAKDALLAEGAMGALMSGSGPTVFGIFPDTDKQQRAKQALEGKHDWRLISTDLIT
jgi:4-diphosphocytidyl-2-C-methyl-D-erythritol kinase